MEELQRLGARRGGDGGSSGGGGKRKGSGRHQRSRGARGGWAGDELAHRLALQTMENYARSLRVRVSFVLCSMIVLLLLSCSRATRLYPVSARKLYLDARFIAKPHKNIKAVLYSSITTPQGWGQLLQPGVLLRVKSITDQEQKGLR